MRACSQGRWGVLGLLSGNLEDPVPAQELGIGGPGVFPAPHPTHDCSRIHGGLEVLLMNLTASRFSVLWPRGSSPPNPCPLLQVSFLEKKVTELENDSLTNGDLKSKLKQENTQLVHRSGRQGAGGLAVTLGNKGGSFLLRPPGGGSLMPLQL